MFSSKNLKHRCQWQYLSLAVWFMLLTVFCATNTNAQSQIAPDATGQGPFVFGSAEYRLPASVDPDILPDRATEVWARIYGPTDAAAGPGPFPVVVFLHGNHATCGTGSSPRIDSNCQYTSTGTCPPGFVVVPNHEGYGYLAERLASHGYVVVSINANRGITCGGGVAGDSGLNLARGRLVLKHLQRLSEWNTNPGTTPPSIGVDLFGLLDFSQLSMMGHSRGGEGVRATYNLYRDAGSPWPSLIRNPVTFKGIFEIAPVDGQTSRILDADGTTWSVLLPMCDGDVSNLQGVRPFDRMLRIFNENPPTQKSTYTVWGANHNFYNTEWQQSDSGGCQGHAPIFPSTIGSPEQRTTGMASILAFIRGNAGLQANPTFNQNFNPLFQLPPVVTSVTRVDRGYTPTPSSTNTAVAEDFDQPDGIGQYGLPTESSGGVTVTHGPVPRHSSVQRAGIISWTAPGSNVYFQTVALPVGQGVDISSFRTLDLRVSRQSSALNPAGPTNFSIQLVLANGLSQAVQLSSYTDLRGPVGGPGGLHPILQTARIPLADFGVASLTQARGVRLTFNDTASGAIYVANIRVSLRLGPGVDSLTERLTQVADDLSVPANPLIGGTSILTGGTERMHEGTITAIRSVASSSVLNNRSGIEIEVSSNDGFPVRGELAVLRIGNRDFTLSRYADGSLNTLIFTLTEEEFAQLAGGAEARVQYGRGAEATERWALGRFDKNLSER